MAQSNSKRRLTKRLHYLDNPKFKNKEYKKLANRKIRHSFSNTKNEDDIVCPSHFQYYY